jgi:FkbM family methyltransferase
MSIERSSAVGLVTEMVRFSLEFHLNRQNLFFLFADYVRCHAPLARSQLFQDLLVLFLTGDLKQGYFVEFGATDGVGMSNTYLLEKKFDWNGILAEPARSWHQALKTNRSAKIDTRCVWSETGKKLDFSESEIGEFSTINEFWSHDTNIRKKTNSYSVETVSLNDLLQEHQAPEKIDYMSLDTEGSELDILSYFDFKKYDIKIVTVEHNLVEPNRSLIYDIMSENGYRRIFEPLSRFDDWYVKHSFLEERFSGIQI